MLYDFSKKEKLKSKKQINYLFLKGRTIYENPIKLIYTLSNFDEEVVLKVGFSVPKKNIKRAVDRNRIKRMLREAYRKNKPQTLKPQLLMILYLSNKKPLYKQLEAKMKVALKKLEKNNP